MIHEEKLNGALNRFSFPRFRSPRSCTIFPYPHLRRPTISITYRFLLPTFRFTSRSIARSALMLYHDLLFLFLSVRLSVYPSIYLSCLFARLSVCLLSCSLSLLSWQTILSLLPPADDISNTWYCIPEIHQNFLTYLASGKQNSHKPDKR